ncbi:MAG: choline kinase family protein [Actinomycetota bacterium]|nr:choline kinase family protein [Actinomycetota bacterium]
MTAFAPPDPRLERVLAALWPGREARPTPMPGGITNHNFLVEVGGERFVARLAGRDTGLLGIDREAERAAAEAAFAAGVGPQVIAFLPEQGCLVTRFIEGSGIPAERMRDAEMLRRVVPPIRAFHQGRALPSTFSPFEVVVRFRDEAAGRGVLIPDDYGAMLERADRIEAAFAASPEPKVSCHNDLLNANFLLQGERVWIVDYEYAGMNDPFFDLGNLSTKHDFEDPHDEVLVALYFGDVTGRRMARLKLMKVMADFWEAMWGVLQQGISTLDFDYVEYARANFEKGRGHAADPRFETWLIDAAEAEGA